MGHKKIGLQASQMNVCHKFNLASAQKLQELKQIKLKKKTATKVHWAVHAYNE